MSSGVQTRRLVALAGFALAMAGVGALVGTVLQPPDDRVRLLLLIGVGSAAVLAGLLALQLARGGSANLIAGLTLFAMVIVLVVVALPLVSRSAGNEVAIPSAMPTPRVTSTPTAVPAIDAEPVVLVGAGDIASCDSTGDEATAALLDEIEGTVFTAGDNAFHRGTPAEFAECYDPSWGRHRDRTRPVPGSHDYRTPGAAGYFGYFGERAGDPTKGYYAYDLGAWRIYALNLHCDEVGGCDAGSPQEAWLRADLAANPRLCVAAVGYMPRFSSGLDGGSEIVSGLWEALHDADAEIYVSGNDYNYERFAPQDRDGYPDPQGLRQFVVGTGGESVRPPVGPPLPNSEVRIGDTFGVLKLTLHADRYEWEFIPTTPDGAGDAGSEGCN